jgi:hypothetical protein
MFHRRYDLRLDPNGTCSVIDIFTGQPAEVGGKQLYLLDLGDADDLVAVLNAEDRQRQTGFGRPSRE